MLLEVRYLSLDPQAEVRGANRALRPGGQHDLTMDFRAQS
jgi:hypothetical protein